MKFLWTPILMLAFGNGLELRRASFVFASFQKSPKAILLDGSVEWDMSGGEVRSLAVTAGESEYLRFTIGCRDLRVSLRILEPNGKAYLEVLCSADIVTPVSLITRAPGDYRLEVRALHDGQAQGRVFLRVDERRGSSPEDEYRTVAEKLFSEAEELRAQYLEEPSHSAIQKYGRAAQNWLQASEEEQAARAHQRIGAVQIELGELETALESFREGARLSQEASSYRVRSELISDLGTTHALLGQSQLALEHCREALSLARSIHHFKGEAKALNCLGEAQYHLGGDLSAALDLYLQARAVWESIGDRRGLADRPLPRLLLLGFQRARQGSRTLRAGPLALGATRRQTGQSSDSRCSGTAELPIERATKQWHS
jgi:tetratricopeptide (TPR) repeat protein